MSDKELDNKELDDVSGGNTNLDKYLKTLAGNDKNKNLVDYGTGTQLDHVSTVQYDSNNETYVLKREKDNAELSSDELKIGVE